MIMLRIELILFKVSWLPKIPLMMPARMRNTNLLFLYEHLAILFVNFQSYKKLIFTINSQPGIIKAGK